MKKSILLTILLMVVFVSSSFANSIIIGSETDIIHETITYDNGQKLKYYETRVLISPLREVKVEAVEEKVVPICNCLCDEEDDITVTYEWSLE